MRALMLEVFYDGAATEPSISVPCVDFFGLPHGRPAPYERAVGAQEGRGFNYLDPDAVPPARPRRADELMRPGRSSSTTRLDYTLEAPAGENAASCTSRSGARTRRRCGATS